ncbi:MAG: fluoride efflux transporter CrcB [Pseudomonadota bacterium]
MPSVTVWMAVAAGGAVGAVSRWFIALRLNDSLPFGTLLVNVVGSFAIGLLFVWLGDKEASELWRAGLITGLLGGFTTFSAFSLETLQLIERGALKTALLYAAGSLIICVIASLAGVVLARSF